MKVLSLLKYLGLTTPPLNTLPPCFFLESTFNYSAQKLHCLPQTQFIFLLYSVDLALSDFGLWPKLKSTFKVWKDWKVMEKNGATCSRQFPKSTSKRAFEEDNTHLCVWVLGRSQNNINTAQMEKRPSISAQKTTNTNMDIRVQQGNFDYSFVHSYIHAINISQATTLCSTPCVRCWKYNNKTKRHSLCPQGIHSLVGKTILIC